MQQTEPDTPPAAIVIFGASGDLTQRKLVPALHTVACDGLLPQAIRVVGVARSTLSDAAFRDRLRAHAALVLRPAARGKREQG